MTVGEATKFVNEVALEVGIEIGQLIAEKRGVGLEAARSALIEAAKDRGCTDGEIEKLVAVGMRAIENVVNDVDRGREA